MALGEPGEGFVSADMGNPQAAHAVRQAGPTVMCGTTISMPIVRPGLGRHTSTILAVMLNPSVSRWQPSTPRTIRGRDYAWEMFQKADAERPGSRATLRSEGTQDRPCARIPSRPPSATNQVVWAVQEKSDCYSFLLHQCRRSSPRDGIPRSDDRPSPPRTRVSARLRADY